MGTVADDEVRRYLTLPYRIAVVRDEADGRGSMAGRDRGTTRLRGVRLDAG